MRNGDFAALILNRPMVVHLINCSARFYRVGCLPNP
jgi:hypothetical protein